MKLPRGRQSGQTLIMALILLALGSLLVVPLLRQSFTNLGYHQSIECRTLHSYSADSGVQYVLAKLYNAPGAYTETPLQESFTLNNRTVDVTAEYQGAGVYKVTSTASGEGCGRTKINSFVNLSAGCFAFGLAGKELVRLNACVIDSLPEPGDGDIHSNGIIQLIGGGVHVFGDVSAVGTITGYTIYGVRTEFSSELTFPGDYSGLYETMAKEEGDIREGDVTLQDETEYLGPTYIDGDLTVKPNTTVLLEGTVYVTGTIRVENGIFDGRENVCAEGNIDIIGGTLRSEIIPILTSVYGNISVVGDVVDGVLFAPNGTVDVNNCILFGAIGANTVYVGNSWVFYASQLSGREDLPGSELQTIAYSYE